MYFRTADVTVSLTWPEGTADAAERMVMPGDNVEMICDLSVLSSVPLVASWMGG